MIKFTKTGLKVEIFYEDFNLHNTFVTNNIYKQCYFLKNNVTNFYILQDLIL